MQFIEERTVSTATQHPLWCCLYMNDSHTFLIKGRLCAGVPLSSELYPPERTVYYHNEIPLREAEWSREGKNVLIITSCRIVLYPLRFIKNWKSYCSMSCCVSSNSDSSNSIISSASSNLVVLPYARGLSEKISQVLCNNNLKEGSKPPHIVRNLYFYRVTPFSFLHGKKTAIHRGPILILYLHARFPQPMDNYLRG